jgi:hypothetical protein
MDLRDLRYFETIADLQHRRAASAKLTGRSRADEQREAPRGRLRRRPLRESRPGHPLTAAERFC